jgi:hypothetical protein
MKQPSPTFENRNSSSRIASGGGTIAAINSCRLISTTILAYALRYATVIPPPKQPKDDLIVPVLLQLLKENKIEPKLRRRSIAALGELLFYISGQDDQSRTLDGSKWDISKIAVESVVTCLFDESDEVVAHYAAKVRILFKFFQFFVISHLL